MSKSASRTIEHAKHVIEGTMLSLQKKRRSQQDNLGNQDSVSQHVNVIFVIYLPRQSMEQQTDSVVTWPLLFSSNWLNVYLDSITVAPAATSTFACITLNSLISEPISALLTPNRCIDAIKRTFDRSISRLNFGSSPDSRHAKDCYYQLSENIKTVNLQFDDWNSIGKFTSSKLKHFSMTSDPNEMESSLFQLFVCVLLLRVHLLLVVDEPAQWQHLSSTSSDRSITETEDLNVPLQYSIAALLFEFSIDAHQSGAHLKQHNAFMLSSFGSLCEIGTKYLENILSDVVAFTLGKLDENSNLQLFCTSTVKFVCDRQLRQCNCKWYCFHTGISCIIAISAARCRSI
jgi:hypothetical protein